MELTMPFSPSDFRQNVEKAPLKNELKELKNTF